MWQYRELSVAERDKLHQCTKVMFQEKYWEGCDGLRVTEAMRVTIAGHASLMLLGTDGYYFDGVRSILVYPHAFHRKTTDGTVVVEAEERAGEAWPDGTTILSWEDVIAIDPGTDYNIVVHEFAHHLDGLDGEVGGTPPFDHPADRERWKEVLELEFHDLCSAAAQGRWTVLRHYGAKNRAEFFAVASECFFQTPVRLRQTHSELYELLRRFYRIEPIDWAQ
jgi:Mlc titration factor MtfA (ptsG expression regulator)